MRSVGSILKLHGLAFLGYGLGVRMLLSASLAAMCGTAQAQYNYTTSNGTVTLTSYTGPGGVITIPLSIDGLPVTGIGAQAFDSRADLTGIIIPGNIANIGRYAFANCTSLTNVTFPDSLITIGTYAFANCAGLSRISIPNSVTGIDVLAFANCTGLIEIAVDPLNAFYAAADGVLFSKDQHILLQYPTGKAGSYSVPDGITCIGESAFHSSTGLTSIAIPDSVVTIGDHAFAWCTRLTSVVIPDSVIHAGMCMFQGCSSLAAVTIGSRVESVGAYAFANCTNLAAAVIGGSVTNVGSQAFDSCRSLTGVFFYGDAPSHGYSVFYRADTAITYYMQDAIGWGPTFDDCPTALWDPQVQLPYNCDTNDGTIIITRYTGGGGSVVIPSVISGRPVTRIGTGAFAHCTNLTSVVIPETVTDVEVSAFAHCTNLIAITVGPLSSVYSSVDGVLFNKDRAALVRCPEGKSGSCSLPEGIRCISALAFDSCMGIKRIFIPNGVTNIDDCAFANCASLTGVYFQGDAPVVAPSAFTGAGDTTIYYAPESSGWDTMLCGHPTRAWVPGSEVPYVCYLYNGSVVISQYAGPGGVVEIPDAISGLPVTGIGNGTFGSCTSVTSVTIPDTVISIWIQAFDSCTSLTNVVIPDSVTNIAENAFANCVNLQEVVLGSGVRSVASLAFGNCTSLTGAYFLGNAPYAVFSAFNNATNATIYYRPEATGWGPTFCGRPTTLLSPQGVLPYNCETNDGAIAITRHTGSMEIVIVPETINGLPVTRIGMEAFSQCTNLTSITIPASVTVLDANAFNACANLREVYFQGNAPRADSTVFADANNVTVYYLSGTAGWGPTFRGRPTELWDPQVHHAYNCDTNSGRVTITRYTGSGGTVRVPCATNGLPIVSIGAEAFANCEGLLTVTIPSTVSCIEANAFAHCANLTGIYFLGNAPGTDLAAFSDARNVIVYYLSGTTGWGPLLADRQTAVWRPEVDMGGFGRQSNEFGFDINWVSGRTVVVEACSNIADLNWVPLQTYYLTSGVSSFNDLEWTNSPSRFYRLRAP